MSWVAVLRRVFLSAAVLALALMPCFVFEPLASATSSVIAQDSPTSGSTTVDGSITFSDQLNVTGNNGIVSYAATGGADMSDFTVASGGTITVNGQLGAGTYIVSGIDSDPNGDGGTWTYTLAVGTITQAAPTSGSTTVDGSITFSDQLNVTGNNGIVSYAATGGADMSDFTVASGGTITVNGQLGAGTYIVSGIDSDPNGDGGTWVYTLVATGTITQVGPTSGSTTADSLGSFSDQLNATGNIGAVNYAATGGADMSDFTVASGGTITVNGHLGAGSYIISGIDSDPNGDSGTWTFTLTVTVAMTAAGTGSKTIIVQTSPFSDAVSTASSGVFRSGPITVKGNIGPVAFVTTNSSASLSVNASGLISTTGTLAVGAYSVSGSDSDSQGDAGTWTYTLTVTAIVTFNANGGTGAMTPENAIPDSSLSLASFVRTRYTFIGWNTSADGTGTSYANGAVFPFTASIELFAQWKRGRTPLRKITFAANGGKGSTVSEVENAPTAITANRFTRHGFTFICWSTKANGRGTRYNAGNTYAFKKSITLYAQWKRRAAPPFKAPPKAHSYAVIFVGNGGVGAMAAETRHSATALTPNHFSRPRYIFVGWNTSPNGRGASYVNHATYPFKSSTTLYARWKKIKVVSVTPPIPGGVIIGPFPPGSSSLSPALISEIQSLAVDAKSKKSTQITLYGFGDEAAPSGGANSELGRARAEAIAVYLEAHLSSVGLKGWTISIASARPSRSEIGSVAATLS